MRFYLVVLLGAGKRTQQLHREIQADKEEDASIGKHRGGGGLRVGGAGVVVCVRAIGGTIRMHIVCGKLLPTGGFSSLEKAS